MPDEPQRPKDFRSVSTAAMDSAIAQCERRLAAGDDRHAALAELYNWGWIHESRASSDFLLTSMKKLIEDGRKAGERCDAAMAKLNRIAAETREKSE